MSLLCFLYYRIVLKISTFAWDIA